MIATVLSRLCFAEPAIDDGLIFYVPFDGFKVDAAVARGNPKSSFAKSIELRNHPGVKGGALMLQENERCDYQLKGNLNPRRGTIACWFKPINWDADDGMFHHFVCIKAPKIPFAWYIYKYYRPNNLMTYLERRRGKQRQRVSCGTSMKEWKRDRWHHVAVTWDSRELRLYADGQLSGKQLLPPEFMPDEFDGTISLAPVGYWKNKWCPPEARTLLDEVRIYDRDLSAREVLELFEKLNPYGNPESRKPSLTVSLNPDIAASRLVASVAALHLDTFWRNAVAQETKLSVEISGPGGIIEKKSIAFAPDAEVAVFVKKWQDGEYSVKAAVEHKGKALAASAQIRKPPTPWLTVKPAVRFIDSVLPPYSPLELKDETIVCWGRSIRLGSGPLPESIQSQGKELLRSPIALRGKIAGRDFTVGGKTVVTYVAGHRITFAGSQEIAGPQDKVAAVSWKGFVEFDGLVRTDISIAPRQGQMNIENLRIDIPLSPSFMR
ncbi:MAG: DUF6067 family protein, partial [Planctomycetota bacterium]|nr:DUF6067 family protein [Planctomycetota bacterium]